MTSIAAIDFRLGVETVTMILAIIGVGVVIFTSTAIMAMVRRQRQDLAHGRSLAKAILQLSLQLEAEERKTRHAVRDLTTALTVVAAYLEMSKAPDFSAIGAKLEEPPDFLAPVPELDPRTLIEGIVRSSEAGVADAAS